MKHTVHLPKQQRIRRRLAGIAVFVLIVLMGVCLFSLFQLKDGKAFAKVRYFDGSLDTVTIVRWGTSGGSVWVVTDEGRTIQTGANNIIIIKGDEEYIDDSAH